MFISYRNNTYWFPPHCTLDLHVHGRITERITLFPPLNCALNPFIDRPTIISLREVYTVNETGNVSMLCRADGLPKPTIIWRKKGSGEVLANGEQFHLLNAQSTDDGSYSCTASNYLGEDTKEVMLNVQSKLFVWFVEEEKTQSIQASKGFNLCRTDTSKALSLTELLSYTLGASQG